MRTGWRAALGLGVCAALCTLVCVPVARADDDEHDFARWTIALDIDYVVLASNEDLERGSGGALRFGSELDLLLVTLIPEGYLGYHDFGAGEPSLTSARIGGRLRIGKILEPGVFGHVGFARVSGGPSYWTSAIDVGLTLDFTLLPLIDLGVHAAYDTVFDTEDAVELSHGNLGVHAAVVF